ncbi:MAG: T9SS type A sorting domain-containing protein [Saprospiraceae bacterium]|nr:T9SS type A sorting domain-containing protein [Saprospiraceae bacterium]
MVKKLLVLAGFTLTSLTAELHAQQSVARQWNEVLLENIRGDLARPPVQARNLFHTAIALYDAWAAYDTVAQTYLLGKTVGNYTCPFVGIPKPADVQAAREEAMSFAAYRVLLARFSNSPKAFEAINRARDLMTALGYNFNNSSTFYQGGSPAALGNYIGQCILQMGLQDGAGESYNYGNLYYQPANPAVSVTLAGLSNVFNPNRWQPLVIPGAVDQNGNPVNATQVFIGPEWGNVQPFSMKASDRKVYQRGGNNYLVYHDPGPMPFLDVMNGDSTTDEFVWNFSLTGVWASHLDPDDGVIWDISPRAIGNVLEYPKTLAEYHDFYDFANGGDTGIGRDTNPRTGQPYQPQLVPRGDYTRVLSQFWADGPNSETPPGHWFTILNHVSDDPNFVKRYNGKGPVLGDLEWDVKSYLALGGAVHDAAIAAWGIKGWYDGIRPITAIRYIAKLGQSSDPMLPRYHPAGIKLVPGLIEQIAVGDPLAGANNVHVGKIKLKAWRGFNFIADPQTDYAGVDWILSDHWTPYQRKGFVTPPFAGYISGHSTYSRAAAETLTRLTGDPYFPGGLGEFHVSANSGYLIIEQGPSVDVTLQWATYRDASDQCSLSRIWGSIHPPFDDIPGRMIGDKIGNKAFELATTYFYKDEDQDGAYSYEDCDDHDPNIHPGAAEICDGLDNNCNGLTDESPVFTYYLDSDGDGYGDSAAALDTCLSNPPAGYVANNLDCDDLAAGLNPDAAEICDGLDNDCNGLTDDLPIFTYYLDSDGDGYGDSAATLDTCLSNPPAGYVTNSLDCNDLAAGLNPGAAEICDGLDNDCNGLTDDLPIFTYYLDSDGDGYGDSAATLDTCLSTAPAGYVTNSLDCNDLAAGLNPGVAEICDGLDNDCNGLTDDLPIFTYYLDSDGDGYGDSAATLDTCLSTAPAGYVTNNLDCDDLAAGLNPGAAEICDGLDNDCNGLTDDLPIFTYYLDNDGDGYGDSAATLDTCLSTAPAGYVTNSLDCNDLAAGLNPGVAEICDGLDNDCNGLTDDLPIFTYYLDSDGDGFGALTGTLDTCLSPAPAGYATNGLDCNDSDPAINPDALEIVDGIDNNCNGIIDGDVSTAEVFSHTNLFPNPTASQLTIQHPAGELLELEMTEMSGKIVLRRRLEFTTERINLDISTALPGMYLLTLRHAKSGQAMQVKVVKVGG